MISDKSLKGKIPLSLSSISPLEEVMEACIHPSPIQLSREYKRASALEDLSANSCEPQHPPRRRRIPRCSVCVRRTAIRPPWGVGGVKSLARGAASARGLRANDVKK